MNIDLLLQAIESVNNAGADLLRLEMDPDTDHDLTMRAYASNMETARLLQIAYTKRSDAILDRAALVAARLTELYEGWNWTGYEPFGDEQE